jgi:hypothetical protein
MSKDSEVRFRTVAGSVFSDQGYLIRTQRQRNILDPEAAIPLDQGLAGR